MAFYKCYVCKNYIKNADEESKGYIKVNSNSKVTNSYDENGSFRNKKLF